MSKVKQVQRPSDIVDIKSYIPHINLRLEYATEDNFTGKVIPGYKASVAYLHEQAAHNLAKLEEELNKNHLGLIIFDAYRPHKSVEFFDKVWKKETEIDVLIKQKYYPNKSKTELFSEGLISKMSSHSRGSTVDLSLIDLRTKTELDMGTAFDFFDNKSFTNSSDISDHAKQNRKILVGMLKKYGFTNYPKEWWHFQLDNEKYKHFYFDFDIT